MSALYDLIIDSEVVIYLRLIKHRVHTVVSLDCKIVVGIGYELEAKECSLGGLQPVIV